MSVYKVEICGVNTAKLPILKEEEKAALFAIIKQGDMTARETYIKGNLRLARVAAEEEEKKQREIDAAVRQKIEEERARLQKEEADETISDDKLSAILGEKSPERKETPQAAEVSQEVETPQVVEKQTDSGEQVSEVIEATVETEQE